MKPVFKHLEPINYYWKSLSLAQSSESSIKVDLSDSYSIESSLAHFSSRLNFMERIEVLKKTLDVQEVNLDEYFKALDMHYDQNLHGKILKKTMEWPKEFINWSTDKDLNPKDFRVFMNDSSSCLKDLLSIVAYLKPTKTNGIKIIDLSLDLLEQDKVSFEKLKSFKNDQALINFLMKTRFTETLRNDEELKERFLKLDLSQGAKVRVDRQGDQNQIVLELKAINPDDLMKKVERVQKKIKEIKMAWAGDIQ